MSVPMVILDDDASPVTRKLQNKVTEALNDSVILDDDASPVTRKLQNKVTGALNDSVLVVRDVLGWNVKTHESSTPVHKKKKLKKIKKLKTNASTTGKKLRRLSGGHRRKNTSDDIIEILDDLNIAKPFRKGKMAANKTEDFIPLESVSRNVPNKTSQKRKREKTEAEDFNSLRISNDDTDEDSDDDIIIIETGEEKPGCSTDDVIVIENTNDKVKQSSRRKKNRNKGKINSINNGQISTTNNEKTSTTNNEASIYESNLHKPTNVVKTGLRPVFIDACNVAYVDKYTRFSVQKLQICIDYFSKRGHPVKAVMPRHRTGFVNPSEQQILHNLEEKGKVVYTPSHRIGPGRGRIISSYEDRIIVQAAAELEGVIVSTDNFRDLVREGVPDSWVDAIENRLLMFTWIGDMLIFPLDPNGKNGPSLEEFLRFP